MELDQKITSFTAFLLRSPKSSDVKVESIQGLMFVVKVSANRKQQDWTTRFNTFPKSPYFALQKDRQGVSNVDTPEVSGRTCVCMCAYVCAHVRVCVYICTWMCV